MSHRRKKTLRAMSREDTLSFMQNCIGHSIENFVCEKCSGSNAEMFFDDFGNVLLECTGCGHHVQIVTALVQGSKIIGYELIEVLPNKLRIHYVGHFKESSGYDLAI